MIRELQMFLKDESGPELVEWAVVTVILILATVAILQSIGGELSNIYNTIFGTLKSVQQK
jgi:Flp pilus assembly pilin Flp